MRKLPGKLWKWWMNWKKLFSPRNQMTISNRNKSCWKDIRYVILILSVDLFWTNLRIKQSKIYVQCPKWIHSTYLLRFSAKNVWAKNRNPQNHLHTSEQDWGHFRDIFGSNLGPFWNHFGILEMEFFTVVSASSQFGKKTMADEQFIE